MITGPPVIILLCILIGFLRVIPPAAAQTPYTDSLKVLIVFVKFADDQTTGDAAVDYREWPLYEDPTRLPASAPFLLSASSQPPFGDSTLTAYFHQQSGGRLLIFGDVHPRTVVTSGPESSYHAPRGGYGDLTVDVVRQLDAGGMDFSDYDYNGDGLVDHIFIILRSDSQKDAGIVSWTGASCLDARCANGPPFGRYIEPVTVDGVRIDWNLSGSIIFNRVPGNVLPHYWLIRMMAHEIGHDFWRRFFLHVPAITNNDVPQSSNYRPTSNVVGYVLMAGAGGGRDVRGDETISAFERHLLGWIDCPRLSSSRAEVRIRDLYSSGDCFRIVLTDRASPRQIFVSNRQRIGPFDRYRRAGVDGQFEVGLLRTTGLLVTLADGYRFEVLPADNSLTLSAENETYRGDMFGPGSRTQITPWTRPTINGYTERRITSEPSWSAIDRIRSDESDRRVMVFDFREDFRNQPVIREDSWMAWETAGETIEGPAVVRNQATLTITDRVTFDRRLTIEPLSSLHIAPDGELILAPGGVLSIGEGATVTVDGTLTVRGVVVPRAGSTIVIGDGGRIRR